MVPQSGDCQDYWQKALDSLDVELKTSLDVTRTAKRDILAGALRAAEEKRQLCLQKRWRFKTPSGEQVILRDVLEKIAKWIDRFKAVGDIATQHDPVHSALAWAGVRFLLTITVSDVQIFGATLENLEIISRLIAQYSEFERLYLQASLGVNIPLEAALTRLYAKILVFLANAVQYFHQGSACKPTAVNFSLIR